MIGICPVVVDVPLSLAQRAPPPNDELLHVAVIVPLAVVIVLSVTVLATLLAVTKTSSFPHPQARV